MSVKIQSSKSKQFVEHSVTISWLSLILIILAGLGSIFFSQPMKNQTLTVSPEERATLSPITLQPRLIGALRIDVKAIIPTNHWVVYEIQLIDDQNQILASAIKEAWRESGTWREDGETGTWSEADLLGGLDVQLAKEQQEQITIAVAVLGYGQTRGNEINNQPVSFRVNVQNGVIDTRYLWLGFFATFVLAILTSLSVRTAGKVRIKETVRDSDVGGRAILGGEKGLVKVTVNVLSDETSPQFLTVNLWIKDQMGKQIYREQSRIKLKYRFEDDQVEDAQGKLEQYFIFTRRASYGFYVEVTPDRPVDRTTLTVKENAKTLAGNKTVKVITVEAD